MPWETSNRHDELPPGWAQIRKRIGNRDGWLCQWPRSSRGICGSQATDCDHRGDRNDHSPENLWMLCRWHHRAKTQDESATARRAIQAKASHPVEQVPMRRR